MIRVTAEVEIERPIRAVFDYLTRPSNMSLYITPALKVAREGGGPVTAGAKVLVEVSFLGLAFQQRALCTVYRRPQSFAGRSLGGVVRFWGRFDLTETDRGTLLRGRGRAEMGSLFTFAEPVLQLIVRKQVEADLRRLKRLLED